MMEEKQNNKQQQRPYGELEVYKMKQGFDIKIWAKKVFKQAVIVLIAGIASVYGGSEVYLVIAPLLTALDNYIKHK